MKVKNCNIYMYAGAVKRRLLRWLGRKKENFNPAFIFKQILCDIPGLFVYSGN